MNVGVGILCGAAGVPVGAFLNAAVECVPDRRPLREGSPRWLGVPVRPWLLGDRRASRRRLAVEVATVVGFAAVGTRYGDTTVVLALLVLVAGLVAATFIDIEHKRIPDRITFPTLAVGVALMAVVSAQHDLTDALGGALVGALLFFGVLLLLNLVYPAGMGFGDVKLALPMGAYLGWVGWRPGEEVEGPLQYVVYALLIGSVLGAVIGVVHRAVTKDRTGFPYGPNLAIGCLTVLLWLP